MGIRDGETGSADADGGMGLGSSAVRYSDWRVGETNVLIFPEKCALSALLSMLVPGACGREVTLYCRKPAMRQPGGQLCNMFVSSFVFNVQLTVKVVPGVRQRPATLS